MTETRTPYTIYTDAEEISINGILSDNHDLAAALLQAKAEIARLQNYAAGLEVELETGRIIIRRVLERYRVLIDENNATRQSLIGLRGVLERIRSYGSNRRDLTLLSVLEAAEGKELGG